MVDLQWSSSWNENKLNRLPRINWRASLVPAAAVIPAPIAYTKVVAVKKLVVVFSYYGDVTFSFIFMMCFLDISMSHLFAMY